MTLHLPLRTRNRREAGGIAAEYLVILFVVAIAAIGAWQAFGDAVQNDVNDRHQEFGIFEGS